MRTALPKSHDPLIRMVEDPAERKRLLIDPHTDLDAYYRLPIQVKRWPQPPLKPAQRPPGMKVLALAPARGRR